MSFLLLWLLNHLVLKWLTHSFRIASLYDRCRKLRPGSSAKPITFLPAARPVLNEFNHIFFHLSLL